MAACEVDEGDNEIDCKENYQSEDDGCSFGKIFYSPPKARNEMKVTLEDEDESVLDDHLRDESKHDDLRQKISTLSFHY